MEKKLPKYFVIKKDSDNPLWKEYIKWLNRTYNEGWSGAAYNYYGFVASVFRTSGTDAQYEVGNFQNNPTLISLQEWDEIVNPKTLKAGDVINLHGINHKVTEHHYYFLSLMRKEIGVSFDNSYIFRSLNLNRAEFSKNILGYDKGGDFPYCKSLEDLTKLVNALKNYKAEEKQNNDMEKITIPEDLFIEGQKAMSKDQLAWFKQNVDPWTRQTTKWFITEYYNREACSGWKEKIEKAFPFVKEDDKAVYFGNIKVFTGDSSLIVADRLSGEFKGKALALSDNYNWEIKRDSDGTLCLIPTKK